MVERQMPLPGDAVILSHSTFCVGLDRAGVLDGTVGEARDEYLCTWNRSGAFRGNSRGKAQIDVPPNYVSCSGGPACHIRAADLVLIGTREICFWRWKDGYRAAHNGEYYLVEVSLWMYDVSKKPWLGKPLKAHPLLSDEIINEAAMVKLDETADLILPNLSATGPLRVKLVKGRSSSATTQLKGRLDK
jgi:hypothetical protein